MTKHDCPSLKHLAMLAKGTLTEDACEILLSHVRNCAHCQAAFRTLRAVELQSNPQSPPMSSSSEASDTQAPKPPAYTDARRASSLSQRQTPSKPQSDRPQLVKAVPVHPDTPPSPSESPRPKQQSKNKHNETKARGPKRDGKVVRASAAAQGNSSEKRSQRPFLFALAGAVALGTLAAGVGIGYFGYLNPAFNNTPAAPNSNPAASSDSTSNPETLNGFSLGDFQKTDPIKTIRVTLELGSEGEMLSEPVDLHLGLGYPLRLHPLGESSDEGFAAIAQQTSLKPDERWIAAGESAWFEFSTDGSKRNQDPLGKTPALLSDTKVEDITKVGIASRGESNWQLRGYKIEINGQLFAQNHSVNQSPRQVLDEDSALVEELAGQRASLSKNIQEYEVLDQAGYLSNQDRQDWENAKQQLAKIDEPLESATARLLGQLPWFEEREAPFSKRLAQDWIQDPIEVTLITSSEPDSGTANPFYLVAGAKKYLLSSPISPLEDGPAKQSFLLSSLELQQDPLTNQDLESLGIGMVAGDHRFAKLPDQAKVDRLLVSTAAGQIFDSEQREDDRNALQFISFIPPSHRDDLGGVVSTQPRRNQRSSWKFGRPLEFQPSSLSTQSPERPETDNYVPEIVEPDVDLPLDPVSVWPMESKPSTDSPQTSGNLAKNSPIPAGGVDSATLATPIENFRDMERLNQLRNFPVRAAMPPQAAGQSASPSTKSARSLLMDLLVGLLQRSTAHHPASPALGGTSSGGYSGLGSTGVSGRKPRPNLAGSTSGSPNSGSGTRVPIQSPPSLPQISQVTIEHADKVEVGKPVVVRWKEDNASSIASYEVRLNAVMPHKMQTPRKLLTSHTIPRIAKTEAVTLPDLKLDVAKLGLEPEEIRLVFIEPEVIALDSLGKPLNSGLSPTGPLAVLHPAGWSKMHTSLHLGPATNIDPQGWIPLEHPDSQIPGYQLGGDGYGEWGDKANRWLNFAFMPSANSVLGVNASVPVQGAWRLGDTQDTDSGLLFAGYPTNVGLHSNQNYITLRFDAFPVELHQNMRLCGLVGFINGSPKTPAKDAKFNMRVLIRDGDPVKPLKNVVEPEDMLRLATSSEVPIVKHDSSGAMASLGLIDIPIQITTDASEYEKSLQQATPNLEFDPSVPYQMHKESPVLISATLMIDARGLTSSDSIGVFAMRLVPE